MGTNLDILPAREFFVGRGAESSTLEKALRAGERLISIIGPSGTGKTRIARQVALRLLPEWEDAGGIWFCDLSAATKTEDLLASVAVVLGIPRLDGQDDGEMGLAHALANRGGLLLVLDNCEYLEVEAKALVTLWLSHAPKLQIVATSLVSLGLQGESLFELGPLQEDEAIALYGHRANQAWSGGRVFSSGEQRALGELVRRLDCLPLAIELAAARVRVLPPLAMLARIEERFELLQSRGDGRHSSLEHAISCSWEFLEPEEALVLSRASVFAGGFTLEAAEEVLAPGPAPAGEPPRRSVLEILESLRDAALIQLNGSAPLRFSFYESMQAFAARELKRAGDTTDAIRRHASFFLRCGERWAQESEGGPSAPGAIESLMFERENLIAVYRRHLDSDPKVAARAAMAVSVATARVGLPSLDLSLASGAVDAAREAEDPRLLAQALRLRAIALHRQGKLQREDLDEALILAEEAGDRRLQGLIYSELACLLLNLGELDEADELLQRGQEIERDCGDLSLAGALHLAMSLSADARGLRLESRHHLELARDFLTASGGHDKRGRVLVNLSQFYLSDGDFDAARTAIHEARAAFHLAKQTDAEATARLALGAVERTAGRLEEAEAHVTAALTVLRRFGSRRFQAIALVNLGLIALEQDQIQLASQRLNESLELIRDTGNAWTFSQFRPFSGAVKAILGQVEEARVDFDAARRWCETHGDASSLAVTSTLEGFLDLALARAEARERRTEEAELHLARAATKFRSLPSGANPSSHALISARRLCERALARYSDLFSVAEEVPDLARLEPPPRRSAAGRRNGANPELDEPGREENRTLLVGPDISWVELQGGPRIDLHTKVKSRKLLQALIEQHQLAPGIGLSLEHLMQVGWPSADVDPTVVANRVYKCVNTLRKSGLDELLLHHADGYLLLPNLSISRQRA